MPRLRNARTAGLTRLALTTLAIFAIVLLALAPPAAHANSVYSSGGLGEPSLEENARLRALGGAGAAEHGESEFSLVNPASIAGAQHLVLEATLLVYLNLCALYYALARWFFLRDTGRKLTHLDRQLMSSEGVREDLPSELWSARG